MKTTDVVRFSAWIVAAVVGLTVAACDDEKQPDPVEPGPTGPLTVSSVIADPKIAAPGDTLQFTAVITSTAPNEGDFPVVTWTASGGSFVENNKQTVRWASPAVTGVFVITARAENKVNSASNHATVFVSEGQQLVPEFAGQVDLTAGGPDFHYLQTTDITRGVRVWGYSGGSSTPSFDLPAPAPFPNTNTVYSPNGLMEAHAADTLQFAASVRPKHIYVGTFATRSYLRYTIDGARPGLPERNVYNHPSFSPNSQVIAYQRLAQAWEAVDSLGVAVPDSFHVYVHDIVANKRTLVTGSHAFPRGFFPTFSTDSEWLVYVLDRDRNGRWELYGSPMNGNDVDTTLASLTRITNTGGLIVSGAPRELRKPVMTWNPVSPVLAIAGADGALHLIQTTGTGANHLPPITTVPRAQELIWALNGSLLAAVYIESVEGVPYSHIVTVSPVGVVTERLTAPAGDAVRDLAFSPDGNWLVYRVTRGGGSWLNALDIGAGVLTEPVAITATDPAGVAGAYRNVMSLRPAWTSANQLIYLSFTGNASGTPGIFSLDLSGLVN